VQDAPQHRRLDHQPRQPRRPLPRAGLGIIHHGEATIIRVAQHGEGIGDASALEAAQQIGPGKPTGRYDVG
jgi:hypothetical protein